MQVFWESLFVDFSALCACMRVEHGELTCLSIILDQMHEFIVFRYFLVYTIMPYLDSYLMAVGLKVHLGLHCLFWCEGLLEVQGSADL